MHFLLEEAAKRRARARARSGSGLLGPVGGGSDGVSDGTGRSGSASVGWLGRAVAVKHDDPDDPSIAHTENDEGDKDNEDEDSDD